MARICTFKTSLFILIGVVVAFTLLLITRYQNPAGAHHRPSQSLAFKSSKEDDLSAYYNHVDSDPNNNNNPPNPPLPVYKETNNNKEEPHLSSVKAEIEYPFEDDFVNQETNNEGEVSKALEKKENSVRTNKKLKLEEDNELASYGGYEAPERKKSSKKPNSLKDISCDVNGGKFTLECKKDDNEVYVPFSFIHKYFEIYGKMSDKDEGKFIWLHSNPKIYRPKSPYDPKGVFTYFENYNVEVRDRVKCVSGAEGVPISTQWDRNGYFYPIQIAQFGLAHYSKYIVEGESSERVILENGDNVRGKWTVNSKSDLLVVPEPLHSFNHIVQIQHTPLNQPVTMSMKTLNKPRLLVLSWDMKIDASTTASEETYTDRNYNSTITATLRYENQLYYLHYVTADFLISVQENHIYHGLGKQSFSKWQHVIRDLGVDVQKGISLSSPRKGPKSGARILRSKLILDSVSISVPPPPQGPPVRFYLDNMTLSANEHLAQFFQAADWFVKTQDDRGGWPIPVRRKFASDFYPVLESGWYSGMGQGHALSLLARAYALTAKEEYALACRKAVQRIFDVPGTEHGVQATFVGKYVWYEEYPTDPSTFVLNGFMYALLGLWDVKSLEIPGAWKKAEELYDKGLISLKTMLPLYDTGSGTFYDLRHFTVTGIAPNPARLDYHVTHINQLLTIATFEEDSIFRTTAERWIGYTQGDRAPHN